MTPRAEVDHLIVAARSLAEGVQWCEATLGVTPEAGGSHPLMGTHNRLLAISAPGFARCYLEIIAIEPGKAPRRERGLRRWFDLDDPALQAGLARHGPRLIHFAARVADAQRCIDALAAGDTPIDRGRAIAAARDSAAGRLEWRISVRDDGQRLFYGMLPTLIEWGAVHPCDALEARGASGVGMHALAARHPRMALLQAALGTLGLASVALTAGAPRLIATLQTPRGIVALDSLGL